MEGPPSKRTRSTLKFTPNPMSHPFSQNNPGANASKCTANYISTHPNSPCTTDTGHTGKIRNPPSCPNTPCSLDTQINNHKRKKTISHKDRADPSCHQPPQLAMPSL
eukprot:617555-Pelagomonas_calceolata.AAC.1